MIGSFTDYGISRAARRTLGAGNENKVSELSKPRAPMTG